MSSNYFAAVIRLSLLCLCVVVLVAQPEFISIDCGSEVNYSDPKTGISWTTDDGYIYTGVNANVGSVDDDTVDNSKQGQTARYFPAQRKKHCYILSPVEKNSTYLIRATFLYGKLSTLAAGFSFDLAVDATTWTTVEIDYPLVTIVKEAVYVSQSTEIAVCLIPNGSGTPFISALELRPLNNQFYDQVQQKQLLSRVARYNCGVNSSNPSVRYPDDPYDRLWNSPPFDSISSITTTSSVYESDYFVDNPPLKVMQTAWTTVPSKFFWFSIPLSGGDARHQYYIALYFADIYSNRSSSDIRGMMITLNNNEWFEYNFTALAVEVRNSAEIVEAQYANFTLSAMKYSTLGPILNAAEIYAQTSLGVFTAIEDVEVLEVLKSSWNLTDWTGDPCMPVSLDWVTCNSDTPPRITQIKLSNFSITGTIPLNINSLDGLVDLWLDNNDLVGNIPYLGGLYGLQSLRLQNNKLNGSIPSSLDQLTQLQELNVANNNLSGTIPPDLLSKNLSVVAVGNPYLCLNSTTCESQSKKKKKTNPAALVAEIIGALAVLGLFLALLICFLCRRRSRNSKSGLIPVSYEASRGSSAQPAASRHPKRARPFSYEEVQAATNHFGEQIGRGGFGPVYYGRLEDGTQVAVKVKSADSRQGKTEFFNEVALLSTVHHRNVVSLVGYCQENDQQILIYEYMEGGTLRDHLCGKEVRRPVLHWKTRIDIALNAAQGLMYLHNDCSPRIVHRDIKSNNILLGQTMFGKIGDFGISKLTSEGDSAVGVSTEIRGTNGYLDPEYLYTRKLTQKSDVYSFSVVLLEIISGRSPYQVSVSDGSTWYIVDWAVGLLADGNIHAVVDPALGKNYNLESVWKVAEMAMFGVKPRGVDRLDMAQIARGLSEALDLENARVLATPRPTGLVDSGGDLSTDFDHLQGHIFTNLDTDTSTMGYSTIYDDEQPMAR